MTCATNFGCLTCLACANHHTETDDIHINVFAVDTLDNVVARVGPEGVESLRSEIDAAMIKVATAWHQGMKNTESALVDGSDLMRMSIDLSKCFDRVPQEIAFQLAESQGRSPRVLQLSAWHVPRVAKNVCFWPAMWGRILQPRTASSQAVL